MWPPWGDQQAAIHHGSGLAMARETRAIVEADASAEIGLSSRFGPTAGSPNPADPLSVQ